jgi:hypothetical protein
MLKEYCTYTLLGAFKIMVFPNWGAIVANIVNAQNKKGNGFGWKIY